MTDGTKSELEPVQVSAQEETSAKTNITENTTRMEEKYREAMRWPSLPSWASLSSRQQWGEKLHILEWEGGEETDMKQDMETQIDEYRITNGWKGNDLVHSISSPVRILEYRVDYNPDGVGTTLTGLVHFTKKAESHQGYCHGGSMTSIFDDVIGWIGFCATGTCIPWSGFTVQINCKLMKPVKVDGLLLVKCRINKMERRKVFSTVELIDPTQENGEGNSHLHAVGDGLVIVNRGVIDGH